MATRQRSALRVRGCSGGRHEIVTPRLFFRTATCSDARRIAATAGDAAAQRWLGWTPGMLLPEEERAALLAAPAGRGRGRFGLPSPRLGLGMIAIDPDRGTPAGSFTLTPLSGDSCELGGHLAPDYRGRGLGAELFTAGLALAHRHLGYREVRAGAEPENIASVRSLWRAGLDPAPGPETYRLSDGRVIPSRWFANTEPNPTRC
ncbi:GNAT family N-acetyltransferase [Actinomadura sp. NAK00032]|uniref:GNAT family N-acetyltransferase n=1 Tax=Actinomadura sp. NAK00032 TaxID=2742128 RepID=UPI00158FF904|nr:GNAT family protein [Actinomadura sp. NAK00032]QKW39272.1 GNAT family N-acetyltransferase [Actinomadura sp. NAK00032]